LTPLSARTKPLGFFLLAFSLAASESAIVSMDVRAVFVAGAIGDSSSALGDSSYVAFSDIAHQWRFLAWETPC
jgi:hypothetical protein